MTSETTLPPMVVKAGRIAASVLACFLLLGLTLAMWVGARGALAYEHLARIQSAASGLGSDLTADPTQAVARVARLAADASDAHALTSDPLWHLA